MKSTAIYSPEPAKGWLPWGAFAPFLCILLVAVPSVAMGLALFAWVLLVERRPLATLGLAGQGKTVKFLKGFSIGMVTLSTVVFAIWAAGGLEAEKFAPALSSPGASDVIARRAKATATIDVGAFRRRFSNTPDPLRGHGEASVEHPQRPRGRELSGKRRSPRNQASPPMRKISDSLSAAPSALFSLLETAGFAHIGTGRRKTRDRLRRF